MHRVDFKKRQKLYLRIFSYSSITFLTIITTAVLLYVALGYRIDRKGEVIRSGLVLISSRPTPADVIIDGESKNDRTDSRFVLPAGEHRFELKQGGYRPWSKDVLLEASGVENLYYPILIPVNLKPKALIQLDKPDVVSQSPSSKSVFLYRNNLSFSPQVVQLDKTSPKLSNLVLPAELLGRSGTLGELNVIEWSQDSKHILVEQNVENVKRLLSIDVDRPEKSIDITARINGSIQDVHYASADSAKVYGVSRGVLSVFGLKDGKPKVLTGGLRSYEPFDFDGVSFVRFNSTNKKLEAGVYRNDKLVIIHSAKVARLNSSGITTYSNYDGDDYLSLRLDGEKKVTIFRNPLDEPVLEDQLPYSVINIEASSLESSDNGQFVLARKERDLVSYDFEYSRKNKFSISKNIDSVSWLGSHHLIYKTKNKITVLCEFDGANSYELLKSDYGQLMFSGDLETSYRIMDTGAKAQIESIDMVVAN